jgi:two-component system chemotaxis response regulator CheB
MYLKRGMAVIARGSRHMRVYKDRNGYFVTCEAGPKVSGHCPSVDVMFESCAYCAKENAIGVILTGMGDDGAKGLLEMKEAGAKTAAQNEETCVVFGMPKEAIKLGAADQVLPLDKLAQFATKPF